MHIIPTIQQNSTNFLQHRGKIKKRNPQNCKQVFINARMEVKKLRRKKQNASVIFIDKNKNYGIIIGYENGSTVAGGKILQVYSIGESLICALSSIG